MNHTYRLVWSEAAQRDVPAAEAARCRGKSGACRALKLLRTIIMGAALGGTHVCSVDAAPTGGTVVAGQGTVSQTGGTTTVRQQSQNLSLNWVGFSISSAETVQFVQPSTTAVALNRVIGTDATQIYGHLVANGQVFLVNPNGVLFAPGAQVDVGGLVASSLNISDSDFLAGNYKFQTGSSNSRGSASPASVVNQGSITAAAGGSVALLGGQVSNQGTITARLGTVALAAGSAMTLDFNGNKLMSVKVDQGAVSALAENRQLIQADGGTVIMTAAARDTLVSTVVNNTGVIEARTIQNQDGEIELLGSPNGGRVNVDGTLDASAPNGGNGGSIETSGAHVEIADTAHITTAASTGKTGTWLVDPTDFTIASSGGDISGATLSGQLANNSVTLVSTSGSVSGNGDIFVNDAVSWSANTTLNLIAVRNIQINGTITASGNTAGLTLNYGSGGNYYVNTGGKVTLSGTNPSLSIGGQAYTVINSVGVQGDTTGTTLQGIAGNLPGWYVLGTDIDASATSGWGTRGFAPLGNGSTPFTGVFDGFNHTITGLAISRPNNSYIGLFGNSSGTIRDVGLLGGSVTGQVNVGALTGYNTGVIYNSYATANVSSTLNQVGGLVGWNDSGSISNSYATGNVSGTNYVGGLVGWNRTGAITDSYAIGNVTSIGTSAGGLVGYMSTSSTDPSISNSYATGSVQGNGDAGGLLGTLINGSITNSYSSGAVTGTTNVGGLVGSSANGTTITNSFWNTTTSGQTTSAGGGTGMTTAQMEAQADFTSATVANGNVNPDWDFTSVWRIYDGHTAPLLKALLTPLTVTADDISATYNGSTSTAPLTNAVYSVAGADTSGHLQGTATAYANDRNAGTYAPDLWSDQQGYDITVKNSTLTINPAVLTITATSNTKTYDGTVTATAIPTISGLQTGDSVTGPTEAYANKNAGAGKILNITGYTVNDSNGGNNYIVNTVSDTSGVISQAALTITAASDTKTYDGSTSAAATAVVTGLMSGDSVTGLTEAYANKNAGTGKTLNVIGYTVNDSNGGNNYTVNTVSDTTGVINQAALTITAASNTKTYDGSTFAAATAVVTGLQSGDNVTGLSEAYADKNAGVGKTLNVTSYTVNDSNGGNNYIVNTVSDTSGVINRAALTIAAASNTKTYDGSTSAAATAVVTGLQSGDSVTGLTEAYANKNAGTGKTLNVTGYTVNDSNGGNNYTVSTVSYTTGVINQAALTLNAASNTKTYDGTITAAGGTVTATGNVAGDTVSASEAYASKNVMGTNASTLQVAHYSITDAGGADMSGNYNVTTTTAAGTINPATIAASGATAASKTYDGSVDATINGGVLTGLIGGDLVGLLQTGSFSDRNAGTNKTVTESFGLTGSDSGNYTLTNGTAQTTANITPKALMVIANAQTKTYGQVDPTLSYTSSGYVTGTFNGVTVNDTAASVLTGTITRAAGEAVQGGPYAISQGSLASNGNYAISYTPNFLTITPATITVTGITGNNKPYDATTTATLNTGAASLAGRIGSDSLGVTATGVFVNPGAGTGKTVAISNLTLTGAASGNYVLASSGNESSVTASITPDSLTITADNATKLAGATNPVFTLTYSGFVAGESASSLTTGPTVSTTAGTTSPAGDYLITASGAVDPNYTFTYVPGTLTVLGNASTSSPSYTGAIANLSDVGSNGTPGSGSGVGEGETHGAALDCSGYVHCVEIPGYIADNDEEDMRGRSKGALSLWSLIILDGGIKLPVGTP